MGGGHLPPPPQHARPPRKCTTPWDPDNVRLPHVPKLKLRAKDLPHNGQFGIMARHDNITARVLLLLVDRSAEGPDKTPTSKQTPTQARLGRAMCMYSYPVAITPPITMSHYTPTTTTSVRFDSHLVSPLP